MEKTCFIYNGPDFQQKANLFLPEKSELSRYEKDKQSTFHLRGEIMNKCDLVSTSLTINSNGDVIPCCYDSYSKHVMGNVFNESVKKVWKGQKYKVFREKIKEDRASIDICKTCPENRIDKLNIKHNL